MADNSIYVPDFNTMEDFSSWVKGLDKAEIQSWKTKDWLAMYDKLEKYTSSPKFAQACTEKGITFYPDKQYLNMLFTNQNVEEFTKLYQNFKFEPEQVAYIRKIAREAGNRLAKEKYVDVAKLSIITADTFDRERNIVDTFHDINNIVRESTSYEALGQKGIVNTSVVINTGIESATGGSVGVGKAELNVNPYALRDRYIEAGFHEANHIHFQTQDKIQQDLLDKGIVAHPEMGVDFQRLMYENRQFYLHPNEIMKHHLKTNNTPMMYYDNEYKKKYNGYKKEPMEKYSNIYGIEAERAYRRATGIASERNAYKVINIISTPAPPSIDGIAPKSIGRPEDVKYGGNVIKLTYKSSDMTPEELLQTIQSKFNNFDKELLKDLNIKMNKTFGEVSISVPTSYKFSQKMDRFLNTPPPLPPMPNMTQQAASEMPPTIPQNIVPEGNKVAEEIATEGAELAVDVTAKTATSAAVKASSGSSVLNTVKQIDDKVNSAIDTVVEKGSETLNNTKVGKAYMKAETAVAESSFAKSVSNGFNKTKDFIIDGVKKGGAKVSKLFTKNTAKATAAVGEAVAKKVVKKTVAKTAGKAVGKSVLKKIPLVSIGAGVVFCVQRAKAGDWAGATAEIASGVLGTFPGLGTAASTAIDVGLAGADIHGVIKENNNKNKSVVLEYMKENGIGVEEKTDIPDIRAKMKQDAISINSSNKSSQSTDLRIMMKHDIDKNKEQLTGILNYINTQGNPNNKFDVKETVEIMYNKYGDNAHVLIQELVRKPGSVIGSIDDEKVSTEQDVVQYFCGEDNDAKRQQIVQSILNKRSR